MPCFLRSSMTISKKSMESKESWSRRRTSGLTVVKSSSGAMSAMMSRTTCLMSSLVMFSGSVSNAKSRSGNPIFLNNEGGIDAQHAERVIQDGVYPGDLDRLVDHEARHGALGVQFIDIDGRVHPIILKRG